MKELWDLIFTYLKNRLTEPSTWRGVVAIAGAIGVSLSPEQAQSIIALALALIGVINVLKRDANSPDSKKKDQVTITVNQ